MRRINSIISMLILALLIASCTQITQSINDTFKETEEGKQAANTRTDESTATTNAAVHDTTESIPPVNFLSDSVALTSAQQQLYQLPKFQGKNLQFYSNLHFYDDGRIMIQLQDPDNQDNVDEYNYRKGSWQDPKPVRITGQADLNNAVSPLSEIEFATVASIFTKIEEASKPISGAEEVTHIYFVHMPSIGKKEWYASVTGDRERFSVRSDINGETVTLRKD